MSPITISTDELVYWQYGFIKLNGTLVGTWAIMVMLGLAAYLLRGKLTASPDMPRWQNALEIIVGTIREQIREISQQDPAPFVPFVGTLFLFIVVSNLLAIAPGFPVPTASLSTTAALATCVLIAVPLFGVSRQGFRAYLGQYLQPTAFMLPFNVIGELSRTLALAVRLYGNMMSGSVIAAVLLAFVPLFVPILMNLLGLLTGVIQAYIFAVLAMVYIASATRVHERSRNTSHSEENHG